MAFNATRSSFRRAQTLTATLAILLTIACPVIAQQANPPPQAVGAASLLAIQARVVAIDPAFNSVTLRGPRGNLAMIQVNPELADVKKLRVGDIVDIAYQKAILISADKVETNGVRERIETNVAQPASGGVVTSGRRVEVVATVQKIDRKHRKITLRGPKRTEEFDVVPDISLDNLKVGDSVRGVFVAAAAASVSRNGVDLK